jgi:predicted XRE-type DNA-binding protein
VGEDILNSSGNVFADLGFPPEEAAILQMRADLMADLRKFIKIRKLTRTDSICLLQIYAPPGPASNEADKSNVPLLLTAVN